MNYHKRPKHIRQIPEFQTCKTCKEKLPQDRFFRNIYLRSGLYANCKKCHNNLVALRKEKPQAVKFERKEIMNYKIEEQPEKIKEIVAYYIENPRCKTHQVAEATGLSMEKVLSIQNNNAYIKALRLLAMNRIANFIPIAIDSLRASIKSMSPEVKLKASIKLLESEGILGPTKVDILVDDLRQRPIEELRAIVDKAKMIPEQTIQDAELIQ